MPFWPVLIFKMHHPKGQSVLKLQWSCSAYWNTQFLFVTGLCVVTFNPAQHLSEWLAVMTFLHVLSFCMHGIVFKEVLSRGTVCLETLLKSFYSPKCTAFVFITGLCVVIFNPLLKGKELLHREKYIRIFKYALFCNNSIQLIFYGAINY